MIKPLGFAIVMGAASAMSASAAELAMTPIPEVVESAEGTLNLTGVSIESYDPSSGPGRAKH